MVQENFDINVRVKGARQAQAQTQSLTKSLGGVATAAKAFVGALAVREVLKFGAAILDSAKKFQTYYNQLRLVTSGQEELESTFIRLQKGARDTRVSLESYIDLFTKLRVSTEQLGYSVEQVDTVTSNLSKALTIAGADTATTTSVIRQFGQAMASGEVRGDEFRSIVEGMGGALTLMSIETGISIGELRKMSREGKLTADVMFEMFLNVESLDTMFRSLNPTLEQAQVTFGDAFDVFKNKLDEFTGASDKAIDFLSYLSYKMNRFAQKEGEGFKDVTLDQIELLLDLGDATTNYTDILNELIYRQNENADAMGISKIFRRDELEEIDRLKQRTQELIQVQKDEAQSKLDQFTRTRELTAEVNGLMRPYLKYIKAAEGYAEMDFGTPIEKARKEYEKSQKVLVELEKAQIQVAHGSEVHFEKYRELEEQINATKIASQEFLEELERLEEMENPFYNFTKHIEDQGDVLKQLDQLAARTYDRMADAVTDFVMTGKFSFKDFARSIIADLVRIAAQAAITFAIKTAAAAVGIPLPFLAEGGPAKKNTPYIVGERGPELFVPNQSGTVVSNEDMTSMAAQPDGSISSAPVNISFNINTVDATSFDELLLTRRGLIASMINEGLARQGRRAIV